MKKLLAIPTLLFAMHSVAECPVFIPANAPGIPAGESASEEEMYQAQVAVDAYVDAIENYLGCNRHLHALKYNRGVLLAEKAAARFNTELRAFRQKEVLASSD